MIAVAVVVAVGWFRSGSFICVLSKSRESASGGLSKCEEQHPCNPNAEIE